VEVSARFVDGSLLSAGEQAEIEVAVTNRGPGTLYQLLATSRSDFRALEDKELAFGRIAPGETVTRSIEFKVPRDSLSRTDDVLISFEEARDQSIDPLALRFDVQQLPRPRFAYVVQLQDVAGGNGDGTLQPGESVRLLVDIENSGAGKALSTYATLKSLSGKDVFLTKGREEIGELPAGERRQAIFEFEIKAGFLDPRARFELAVMDVDLRVYAIEKLSYPLSPPGQVREVSAVGGAVRDAVPVREAPTAAARIVAQLPAAAIARVEAETDGFYRIELNEGRSGWVGKDDLRLVTDGEPVIEPASALEINAPPALTIERTERVVRRSTLRLRCRATDEHLVRDAYVFVGENKVFFVTNKNSEHPRELIFEIEVPLEQGLNFVTVVAEETADLDTREVITVRRDREDGMPFIGSRSVAGKPELLGIKPVRHAPSPSSTE
jgi:carboxyl-terminal processing protease